MATVWLNTAFDLQNFPLFSGTLSVATSTLVTMTSGGQSLTCSGTGFTYKSGAVSGGAILSLTYSYNGTVQFTMTGLGASAQSVFTAMRANDLVTLQTQLFSGSDTFIGSPGADTLWGGQGYNVFVGGKGNDSLCGGPDEDVADYSTATAAVSVNLATGRATGGAGNDSLSGIEIVWGSAYADTIIGGAQNDSINGGEGNDSLRGGDGIDLTDYTAATAGVNVNLATGRASGGAGNDSLSGFEILVGSRYADTLLGSALSETLSGNSGNDSLDGGAGADVLWGGDGNDTLSGGLGYDSLDGGDGIDLVDFSAATAGVSVNLITGRSMGAGLGIDTLANFENIQGGDYNDTLIGDNLSNTLTGGLGNDSLNGGDGFNTADYSTSTGAVQVNMTTGRATGAAGNDTLAGFDSILGGAFNDTLIGGADGLWLDGGAGTDLLVGGTGGDNFVLHANDSDSVIKTSGNAVLRIEGTEDFTSAAIDLSTTGTVDMVIANGSTLTFAADPAAEFKRSGLSSIVLHQNGPSSIIGVVVDLKGTLGDDYFNPLSLDCSQLDGNSSMLLSPLGGNDTLDMSSATDNLYVSGLGAVYFNSDHYVSDNFSIGSGDSGSFMSLITGAGNDTIVARYPTDGESIDGGAGENTLILSTVSAVNANLALHSAVDLYGQQIHLANIRNVYGSENGDTLIGDDEGNFLVGNGGSWNMLNGGGGNDTLMAGDDSRTRADYLDTLLGGAGNDMLMSCDFGNASMDGGAGNDSLGGCASSRDTLLGGDGDDYFSFGTHINRIFYFDAYLNDAAGMDSINGGAGYDTLFFFDNGYGTNDLDGVKGVENVRLGDARTAITFGASYSATDWSDIGGVLRIDGSALTLHNTLAFNGAAGSANGAFLISGGCAADTISGGAGNDTLSGGLGYDSLSGGAGEDMLLFTTATGGVNVNLATGRSMGAGQGVDTLAGFEDIRGGAFNDTLAGDAGDNTLSGGLGNDMLIGGAGSDTADYSEATGAVQVNLSSARATGAAGNDTLYGFEHIQGGAGDDSLTGNALDNVLLAGAGNDSLYGAAGRDCLLGGDGNDRLTQGSGNSLLMGGAGADLLIASAANAVLGGGTGNDTLNPGAGADVILFNAGDGKDNVNGSDVDQDDTVSLGGGITRSQLSLTKSGNNLVLNTGAGEGLTFMNWYATTNARTSVLNLQLIEGAAADFNAGSADPLLSSKVLSFNFAAIVADFDAARGGAASFANWSMGASMAAHLSGNSSTATIGGDLAYQYGMTGNLAAVGATEALNVLSGPGFATTAQTLQSDTALGAGSLKLG